MFDQDAAAPLQFLVKNAAGVLADATLVQVTVTKPDLSVVGPTTVTSSPAGTYSYNAPTDLPGRYTYRFQATGANFTAKSDSYFVRSATSKALLSLADAKAALNIDPTDYSDDEEIRDRIDIVTDRVEGLVGYVLPQAVTTTLVASGTGFFLPGPVISITSLTPVLTNGWVYSVADFLVETSGFITRLDGSALSGQAYTVIYQAGYPQTVLPRFQEAARLFLQHFWQTQRGDGLRPGQADDDAEARAIAILQPYRIVSVG